MGFMDGFDNIDDFLDDMLEENQRIEEAGKPFSKDDDSIEQVFDTVLSSTPGITIGEPEPAPVSEPVVVPPVSKGYNLDYGFRKNGVQNLHLTIIKEDTPYLWKGSRTYTETTTAPGSVVNEQLGSLKRTDGSTLADYFANKKRNKQASERSRLLEALEREQSRSNIVTPYQKGLIERREKRLLLSKTNSANKRIGEKDENKFLRKWRQPTVYEKTIIKNLGLSEEDLAKLVSPNSLLTKDEKIKLLSASSMGNRAVRRQGKGNYVSAGDLEPLKFIETVKLASLKNLYYATGMGMYNLDRRLRRLEKCGLVRNLVVYNSAGVWGLTATGASFLGSNKPLADRRQAGLGSLSERLYVNHVTACLWGGRINILQLEDFPVHNRPLLEGDGFGQGEDLVTEATITQGLYKMRAELMGGNFVKQTYKGEASSLLRDRWEIEWRKWENSGRPAGSSPELLEGGEWLYTLLNQTVHGREWLLPDIIVKRPRGLDGSSNHIAVEVERSQKKLEEYVSKLEMYKEDNRVYGKVVYVTASPKIAEQVTLAAAKIGFTRFDIVPVINEDGIAKANMSGWEL